ncbi:alpha-L-rhamnosidase-related protein [Tengunoibacter tsumagoiensis]|uniref:Alpha-L-rhamnosidase six-hairpin glycosidase domain-containing protein n=1 Tax=Tengunoibacter tsumagoiensis TaxID=2014871 RepID=A0A402A7I8_9CHLR|nr:family 78 glycoside hydrolase catalytic domain [Tengunoibacter tsumagoiensis]GCE15120.1 hypothetical protein KTT_49790 [Tengunoibacter tsumagoiensis]
MRVILSNPPYEPHLQSEHRWPCAWISHPAAPVPPFVTAYRCSVVLNTAGRIRLHISADERYVFYLDGEVIGRGSERGTPELWYVETYDLDVLAGEHMFVAVVWSLGELRPAAQTTVAPGFLCSPQEPEYQQMLGTGIAPWQVKLLEGYGFALDPYLPPPYAFGPGQVLDGRKLPWGYEQGAGAGWVDAHRDAYAGVRYNRYGFASRLEEPATLPPQSTVLRRAGIVRHIDDCADDARVEVQQHREDEALGWDQLIQRDVALILPPQTTRRILLDLQDYMCAYPHVTVSNGEGSVVRIAWAESLFHDRSLSEKGNRHIIHNKYFRGYQDTFVPDSGGQRHFTTLWWRSGRYLLLSITTGEQPLLMTRLQLEETCYPLEQETHFTTNDIHLNSITGLSLRTLQMCMHEIYIDCPYYEQLMYVSDTRLMCLVTMVITHDDRLVRKAIAQFGAARLSNGLIRASVPGMHSQVIPSFTLWWVGMVYDYALWRGEPEFVYQYMPVVRMIIETFLARINLQGLIQVQEGWNFIDGVPEWEDGNAPDDDHSRITGMNHWQVVLALEYAAALEEWIGEDELAQRNRRLQKQLAINGIETFWVAERGLFADDCSHTRFSEHTQCLALLSNTLPEFQRTSLADTLFTSPDLTRMTISFRHYLFEACALLNRPDVLLKLLDVWYELLANGLYTTIEAPEPTRSDCHGWGTHPLYHQFATLLGIRPAEMGFGTVVIHPRFGSLQRLSGKMVHPSGFIVADLVRTDEHLTGSIELPDGVTGWLEYADQQIELRSGYQKISV